MNIIEVLPVCYMKLTWPKDVSVLYFAHYQKFKKFGHMICEQPLSPIGILKVTTLHFKKVYDVL